ncbi:hypothetical protein AAMO2058_000721100, partial [Amorphochlora amoebiformis]
RIFHENSPLLPTYAAAYVPARALCYYGFLSSHKHIFGPYLYPLDSRNWSTKRGRRRKVSVVFLGGGPGSELLGFASFFSHLINNSNPNAQTGGGTRENGVLPPKIHFRTFDIGDFSHLHSPKNILAPTLTRAVHVDTKEVTRAAHVDTKEVTCAAHVGTKEGTDPKSAKSIQEGSVGAKGFAGVVRSWFKGARRPVCRFQVADILKPGDELLKVWSSASIITLSHNL